MGEERREPRLLLLIARDEAVLDELITGMLDAGMSGATVVESKGLGAILRQDMPIFAGLAALLPQHTGSRVVLSLTYDRNIESLRKYIDEMPREQRPIGIVLPVDNVFGLQSRTEL